MLSFYSWRELKLYFSVATPWNGGLIKRPNVWIAVTVTPSWHNSLALYFVHNSDEALKVNWQVPDLVYVAHHYRVDESFHNHHSPQWTAETSLTSAKTSENFNVIVYWNVFYYVINQEISENL